MWGADPGRPSEKQIALAERFGRDISACSKRVGAAVIDAIMTQLNIESIESQGLAPGVLAVRVHDSLPQPREISSIQADGTVYFRGAGCIRARNVRRVDAQAACARP
jgi:hypothetical protein